MLRLQWLTLWDETREFFETTPKTDWGKHVIVAKMDSLEREFILKSEAEAGPSRVKPTGNIKGISAGGERG